MLLAQFLEIYYNRRGTERKHTQGTLLLYFHAS
jgi:hypothetical protein